jgi:type 1 fimbria pilin
VYQPQQHLLKSTQPTIKSAWSGQRVKSPAKKPLRAKLVETQAGGSTTGQFSAVATFNFYYD